MRGELLVGDADGTGGFFGDNVFILRGENVSYIYIVCPEEGRHTTGGSLYNTCTKRLLQQRLPLSRLVQLDVAPARRSDTGKV